MDIKSILQDMLIAVAGVSVFALASQAEATTITAQPWTNEATAPSYVRDRGIVGTYEVLSTLKVEQCARWPIAQQITDHKGTPLWVSNEGLWSVDKDFDPTMYMSFNKTGVDYAGWVEPKLQESFIGELYEYTCDGTTTYIGLMPKCQNLAIVEPYDGHDHQGGKGHHDHGNGNGYGHYKDKDGGTNQVPEPSPVWFLLWLLILWRFFHDD